MRVSTLSRVSVESGGIGGIVRREANGRGRGKDGGTLTERDVLVGSEVLSLVTAGMYGDARTVYREYLQNVADAAADAPSGWGIDVEIEIDVTAASIRIRDNGPGLGSDAVARELVPIGRSRKAGQGRRGFRGVGRLAGLAFAERVRFRTRSRPDAPVAEVLWDAGKLRSFIEAGVSARDAIGGSVETRWTQGNGDPEHFFEVHLDGVRRTVASAVLNVDSVRDYIGAVCPVPFRKEFMDNTCIREVMDRSNEGLTLAVRINGEDRPLRRPLRQEIPARGGVMDRLESFESVRVPRIDGVGQHDIAAVGWIAHSSYLGALPRRAGVRGLRARMGNIQIGGEEIFEHLFAERRFNQWCVAEIHIVDQRIRPNGRRDYFEVNQHLRHLENHVRGICRQLERRCRRASGARNAERHRQRALEDARAVVGLIESGCLKAEAAVAAVKRCMGEFKRLEQRRGVAGTDGVRTLESAKEVELMEDRLRTWLQAPSVKALTGVPPDEEDTYREIFSALVGIIGSPRDAQRTIDAILMLKESR